MTAAARCQHVGLTPWGPSQCALEADHSERHAYSPSEHRDALVEVIAASLDVSDLHHAVPVAMEERIADAVEDYLATRCRHCGKPPEKDGDHSCPCPNSDADCEEHG